MKTFYVVYRDRKGSIENMVIELKDVTKVNAYTIKRGVLKSLTVQDEWNTPKEEDIIIISWQETQELTQKEFDIIEEIREEGTLNGEYATEWDLMCGDYDEKIFEASNIVSSIGSFIHH